MMNQIREAVYLEDRLVISIASQCKYHPQIEPNVINFSNISFQT